MKNIPVLVGVNQFTQRWQDNKIPLEPMALMEQAAQKAIFDTNSPQIKAAIDTVFVVNIVSYQYEDAPAELCKRLGINAKNTYYSSIGGNSPQYLLNKAATMLEKGEAKAVLLAGAEAVYGFKKAGQKGMKLDWMSLKSAKKIDGDNRPPTNDLESLYELFMPATIYPILETALRANKGSNPAEHQKYLGQLYEKIAQVAARNPEAWVQAAYLAEEIINPTEDNRYIAYPYTKRMNANMTVDMAAALVMTTEKEAEKLGISKEKWVYPMAGIDLNEVWEVSRRPKLYESQAICKASKLALEQAGLSLDEINAFDIYACFPVAVQISRNAIGLNENDPRPFTLTGGLAYFGGPGSNYNMHAIVEAVERIRKNPSLQIMTTAVGWSMTKHSIGIYGKKPPAKDWQAIDTQDAQNQIDASALPEPVLKAEGILTVEAYTLKYDQNGKANKGIVIGKLEGALRTVAYLDASAEELSAMEIIELVGKKGLACYDESKKRNFVRLED